jgi:hypothetical protein
MGKVQVAILAGALYTLLRDAVFAPVRSRSRFSRSRHSSRLGKENGIVSKHLTFQRRKTKAEEKYGSRVDPPSREASTFAEATARHDGATHCGAIAGRCALKTYF